MKRIIIYILLVTTSWSCKQGSESEKYQDKRNNVVDVQEFIKDIKIKDVLISNISWPYVLGEFLIIRDYHSPDKLIHIFNKNSFDHVTSIANKGKGPGEIVTIGHITPD